MGRLTSISLAELKVYPEWRNAPLGSLLQASDFSDEVLIGMRAELKIDGLPQAMFLVLEGPKRGEVLEESALKAPAIDVSDLLVLHVANPCPVPFGASHSDSFGIVCESAGPSYRFVRGKLGSGMRVYVWLVDPSGVASVGTVETDKPPDLLVLGHTETVQRT